MYKKRNGAVIKNESLPLKNPHALQMAASKYNNTEYNNNFGTNVTLNSELLSTMKQEQKPNSVKSKIGITPSASQKSKSILQSNAKSVLSGDSISYHSSRASTIKTTTTTKERLADIER